MSFGETLSYLAVGNPVSQAVLTSASAVLKGVGIKPKHVEGSVVMPNQKPITMWNVTEMNYHFIRLAGLSGCSAVVMGAYGRYILGRMTDVKEQAEAKAVFETANRFHFLHSVAFLSMPLVRRPAMTGSLMVAGCLLFCGPMYYRALTGDKTFIRLATCGGFCLIAAWASLIF